MPKLLTQQPQGEAPPQQPPVIAMPPPPPPPASAPSAPVIVQGQDGDYYFNGVHHSTTSMDHPPPSPPHVATAPPPPPPHYSGDYNMNQNPYYSSAQPHHQYQSAPGGGVPPTMHPSYYYSPGGSHIPLQPHNHPGGGGGGATRYNEVAPPPGGSGGPFIGYVEDGDLENQIPRIIYISEASIKVRMAFIRRVYSILLVQLAITMAVAGVMIFVQPIKSFVHRYWWLYIVSFVITFIGLLFLKCVERKFPANLIFLYIWTAIFAFGIGFVASLYDVWVVFEAVVVTALIVVSLTFYTFQSKRDFSSWGAGLFCALWGLMLTAFIQIILMTFFHIGTWLYLVYCAAGAIIFSLFIVFDTSRIIRTCTTDMYVEASISLYLDIVNLFLYVLSILAQLSGRNK